MKKFSLTNLRLKQLICSLISDQAMLNWVKSLGNITLRAEEPMLKIPALLPQDFSKCLWSPLAEKARIFFRQMGGWKRSRLFWLFSIAMYIMNIPASLGKTTNQP